jgi:hypothetical protein
VHVADAALLWRKGWKLLELIDRRSCSWRKVESLSLRVKVVVRSDGDADPFGPGALKERQELVVPLDLCGESESVCKGKRDEWVATGFGARLGCLFEDPVSL